MNKVYILRLDGWYDCSDNGRDSSEIVGIYSSEESAFQAFEKEGKRLFGDQFSLEEAKKSFENSEDTEKDNWGSHTGLCLTEHPVLDNSGIDGKDNYERTILSYYE